MPALNFKKQFADAVERGEKRQTIRARRRDHRPSGTVGKSLTLYTGLRSKNCRKLMDAVCTANRQLVITNDPPQIFINGVRVEDEDGFARADGFDCRCDLYDFFEETHGLPFHGSLIEWETATPKDKPWR